MSADAITFDIDGATVALRGLPVDDAFLDAHYASFWRRERKTGDVALAVTIDEARGALDPVRPGDEARVSVSLQGGRVVTSSHWHAASIDVARGTGDATFTDLDPVRLRVSLENLLRVTFASLLLRRRSCLVHAAGLLDECRRAHAFVGLSGSGKSEIVRLSPGRVPLSDDMIALVLDGSTLFAVRVPFFGAWPTSARAPGRHPVASLVHVERAPETELAEIPRALQAAHLRACMPFLPPADERALDLARDVVTAHPMRALRFGGDARFWELLA